MAWITNMLSGRRLFDTAGMALAALTIAIAGASLPAAAQSAVRMKLVFCCKPSNDLYTLLSERGGRWTRFDKPQEAVRYAPQGSGVLILADGYPDDVIEVSEELFDIAAKKDLRVYIEFAKNVPGIYAEAPRELHGERVVVATHFFKPALDQGQILTMHNATVLPLGAVNPDLVAYRVAGYDKTPFNLPQWMVPSASEYTMFPILIKNPLGEILVSATALSQFVTGRYAPTAAWRSVWESLLEWLAREKAELPEWIPTAAPAYEPTDVLPADAEGAAVRQGAQWYFNAKLLVHAAWADKAAAAAKTSKPFAPDSAWPAGDGKLGVLEGVQSRIEVDGSQPLQCRWRNDCTGETAMALAFDGAVHNSVTSRGAADGLPDFIYTTSEMAKGPRSDPTSPSYGLVGWDTDKGLGNYYGDDNARSLLGVIATASLLKTDRWDEAIMRGLLANFRTTGAQGFRENCITEEALQKEGWQHFFNASNVSLAPHYQAYLWAAYLWAYKQTGYAPFLERTKTAIRATMAGYPDQWHWTNGIQQERARMLLPLAWLIRVEDTPEYRQWLQRLAADLLALQDGTGAIREQFGAEGMGTIPPLKSNEEYGRRESPIIQADGDPACDLLYTCNFALFGLHEAAAATGDAKLADAEKKLAEFLCRIQIRSEKHAELDGGWYRAFDFKKWEYWGSSGDEGWGAWSIESGWTQGWIVSAMAMRQMKTTYWDLTARPQMKSVADAMIPVMLP